MENYNSDSEEDEEDKVSWVEGESNDFEDAIETLQMTNLSQSAMISNKRAGSTQTVDESMVAPR